MATVVESAGTDGRQVLVKYDDGTILLIDRDYFNTYDNYIGATNDHETDLDELRNHVNESGIYEFTDSTGGGFDINTINTRNDLVLTRDDGTTYVFDVTRLETYEDYDASNNDNAIDINEIANHVDDDNIVQFIDSSGGEFTLQPGSGQNSDEFMIVKDDGTVLQVEAADFLNSTLDPNSDGVVDVDGIAADGSNVWEWYDSTGAEFDVIGSPSSDNDIVIARDDGTKLVVDVDNNNTYDDLGSTNNDGRIDIDALSDNIGDDNIFEFYDSTGDAFTLIGLNGDRNMFALQRADGTSFLIDGDNFDDYADYDASTNDGRIDVSEIINHVNSDGIYQVIDSSGESFVILGGADDTDYDDIHFARANGEVLTVRFDTIESDADRLAGTSNDNVIDLVTLSDNVDDMGSGFKYDGATVEPPVLLCFTQGALIKTRHGEVPIEDLTAGDEVWTLDSGYQKIRWIGSRQVEAKGNFAPISFAKGVIGNHQELLVSPQHRMLITGWMADLYVGHTEVLVAAKHLVNGETITIKEGGKVRYFHMLFDKHEIVEANGTLSESFYPGAVGQEGLTNAQAEEVYALFPDLQLGHEFAGEMARMPLKAYEAGLIRAML